MCLLKKNLLSGNDYRVPALYPIFTEILVVKSRYDSSYILPDNLWIEEMFSDGRTNPNFDDNRFAPLRKELYVFGSKAFL